MADFLKSANFNGTNGSHFYIQLYQSYTQDINANTSTVTYTLYFGSQDGYSGSGATYTGYIGKNYNGRASVGSGSSIGRNTKITIGSRTLTYNHNADGTCSASYYALLDTPWSLGDASLSGSFTLKTIPRASSITATSADVGTTSIINITRASSSFTHTLSYNFDGITGTIVSKTSQTSYSWTIPDSFYAKLSDVMYSTGKTCTITCDTYNGNTKIGTKTTTMKVTVADNNTTKPTLSATYSFDSLTETLTGVSDKSIAIRGVTDVTISAVTATPQSVNGSAVATIASKRVDCGSQYRTTAGTINNIDSDKIVVSATDSRGISNSRTYTTTLKPYINLTIVPNFYRTNPTESTVKLTYTGKYYNDNFGSTSETANTLTLKYRYREATSSTWSNYVNLTPTISGNDYSNGSSEITIGTGFDYQKSYKFEIVATDKVGSITKIETVTQGIPVFDWDKDDFQFNVPVTVNGNATVNGTFNATSDITSNTSIKGNNGFYSRATGEVGTATSANGMLLIKRANNSEAPNNGVVLEYGNSTSWKGQLYIGDNATQGVYLNGWSNGTRGSWERLAMEKDVPIVSKDNASNPTKVSFKFPNGLLINTVKISYSSVACSTAWGGVYASANRNGVAYQTAFTTLLSINGSCFPTNGNHWLMFTNAPNTSTTPTFQLVRGTNSSVTGYLYITAVGLWI